MMMQSEDEYVASENELPDTDQEFTDSEYEDGIFMTQGKQDDEEHRTHLPPLVTNSNQNSSQQLVNPHSPLSSFSPRSAEDEEEFRELFRLLTPRTQQRTLAERQQLNSLSQQQSQQVLQLSSYRKPVVRGLRTLQSLPYPAHILFHSPRPNHALNCNPIDTCSVITRGDVNDWRRKEKERRQWKLQQEEKEHKEKLQRHEQFVKAQARIREGHQRLETARIAAAEEEKQLSARVRANRDQHRKKEIYYMQKKHKEFEIENEKWKLGKELEIQQQQQERQKERKERQKQRKLRQRDESKIHLDSLAAHYEPRINPSIASADLASPSFDSVRSPRTRLKPALPSVFRPSPRRSESVTSSSTAGPTTVSLLSDQLDSTQSDLKSKESTDQTSNELNQSKEVIHDQQQLEIDTNTLQTQEEITQEQKTEPTTESSATIPDPSQYPSIQETAIDTDDVSHSTSQSDQNLTKHTENQQIDSTSQLTEVEESEADRLRRIQIQPKP